MKYTSLLFLLILSSCFFENKFRLPASSDLMDYYQIGDIKTSLLAPDQFRALHGTTWTLMDGGVDFAKLKSAGFEIDEYVSMTGLSAIPDARGAFLRMANWGRNDGKQNPEEIAIGNWQGDAFQGHYHKIYGGAGHLENSGGGQPAIEAAIAHSPRKGVYASDTPIYEDVENESYGGKPRFTKETRPKNISVNFYVKFASCASRSAPCL